MTQKINNKHNNKILT